MKISNNDPAQGMSLIVKTISRTMVGPVLLYGIYVAFFGHNFPGGGFAGGFIIALAYVLFMLAFGKAEAQRKLPKPLLSLLEGIGARILLAIAALGFIGSYFFLDRSGYKITAAIANIAIALLEVTLGLFGIFLVLILLTHAPKKTDEGKKNTD